MAQVNEQIDRFGDIVTPNLDADILVTGNKATLNGLDHALSRGSFVQHMTEPSPQKRDKG
mgnify:CR=1 FL=1